ncbi:hypothetical protein C9427_22135 [Mesorhizobium helmanticense]|uniref:Uncharacterized protein n=1 Tax=Mesorhizobium helmanticense TaxID=1776423 RepID=A0A2T4IRR1_9HYPH|nr:hypothetical protein C9427_22135 [Mesorhizobium helmanticense]
MGAFVGPSLFGYAFDSTGTYSGLLEACALLLIGGAATVLFLGLIRNLRHSRNAAGPIPAIATRSVFYLI